MPSHVQFETSRQKVQSNDTNATPIEIMLNFLGIGAQKSGTTWLYEKLCLHPNIRFPAGKEIHFWDKKSDMGLGWYRSLFDSTDANEQLCGEITPAYSCLPSETIRECHENFPKLKLIYVLRNPIERAWSAAKMELLRAELEIGEVSEQWFVDQFQSRGSQMRGDYETCLRNWLAHYPQEQVHVCFFEELVENPGFFLAKCYQHLGLPLDSVCWNVELGEPLNKGIQAELSPSLRCVLEELYFPKIRSLQNFLGLRLSNWI